MALGQIYQPKAANEPKPVEKPAEPVEVIAPANEGQEQPDANNASPETDDLISKVTQFEIEKSPAGKSPEEVDAELFNDREFRAEIDRVKSTNPELARHMELMRKSAISGVNSKFQQLAELRKELESVRNGQTSNYRFRANSIDELLNNPEFLNEAKSRVGGERSVIADDPILNDETKAYIQNLETKLKSLEEGITKTRTAEAQEHWSRQHDQLSSRYKNYSREEVDQIAQGLATGKVQATPEYLYKVLKHDENVKKAYELGRREGMKVLGEKREVTTGMEGINAVRLDDISQEEKESNLNFMQKIIAKRLAGAK